MVVYLQVTVMDERMCHDAQKFVKILLHFVGGIHQYHQLPVGGLPRLAAASSTDGYQVTTLPELASTLHVGLVLVALILDDASMNSIHTLQGT